MIIIQTKINSFILSSPKMFLKLSLLFESIGRWKKLIWFDPISPEMEEFMILAHWLVILRMHVFYIRPSKVVGEGVGAFSKVVAIFRHVAGLLIFYGHHWGCLNNPIFSNSGLCAACWAHFMCPHELWPTSVSHPFSSLNSSLGLTGGKYYQKIIIPIFRLVIQNFAFLGM